MSRRRRRYRKNPSTLAKGLMIGGGALAAFFVYSKFFAGKASAATITTHPITGKKTVVVTPAMTGEGQFGGGGGLSELATKIGSGISSLFTSRPSAVELNKNYQAHLNSLGARLVVDGIIGQKTLDASNKLMPMKYTSIKLLAEAIQEGTAGQLPSKGVAGLGYLGSLG